jgi:WD40 repeat protein
LTALPNGDLVSGSSDYMVNIWNPNDGKLKQTLKGHSRVRQLITLPNGNLVSASADKTIKIWHFI